eukprot:m.163951 g.163951  ORF g.163951 m.163951 type:complete len:387 (-) comp31314_c3_seq1:44-1204(-)
MLLSIALMFVCTVARIDAVAIVGAEGCPVGYVRENTESNEWLCRGPENGWVCPVGSVTLEVSPFCARIVREAPKIALVMRTYHGDKDWLPFSLRSIQKFALSTIAEVVVVYPENDEATIGEYLKWNFSFVKRVRSESERDFIACNAQSGKIGYTAQIYDKMIPNRFVSSDVEYIVNLDSDSILLRPLELTDLFEEEHSSLMVGGKTVERVRFKPKMQRRPWSEAGPDALKAWKSSTEEAIGVADIPYSFMLRQGQMYPVWVYESAGAHMMQVHEKESLLEVHLASFCPQGLAKVSEFEILGAIAWHKHENTFFWEETAEEFVHFPVHQSWSWGGLTPEIRAFYNCCLDSNPVKDQTTGEWIGVGYLRAPGHAPDPYGGCLALNPQK